MIPKRRAGQHAALDESISIT